MKAVSDKLTKHKRTAAQRAADLIVIERETLRGARQHEIATLLATMRPYRLSRQMITYDLKDLERRWLREADKTVAAERAKMILSLEEQRRELWAAWEKSKADATTKTAEQVKGGGKSKGCSKQRVTVEGQCGDPAYQRLILDIDERLAKLLGLDPPTRNELSGSGGQPLTASNEPIVILWPHETGSGNGKAKIEDRDQSQLEAGTPGP